jgi:hypothetical protein
MIEWCREGYRESARREAIESREGIEFAYPSQALYVGSERDGGSGPE